MELKSYLKKNLRPGIIILLSVLSLALLWPALGEMRSTPEMLEQENIYKGQVLRVISEVQPEPSPGSRQATNQTLSVRLTAGEQTLTRDVLNDLVPVSEGDRVFVQASSLSDRESEIYVIDVARGKGLLLLTVVFVVLVLAVAGKHGLAALAGLLFSLVVIFQFVIPWILAGVDPVLAGLGGSVLILLVTLYASHGLSKKSIAAFLGIVITLSLTAFLADFTAEALHFTGFSGEESVYLNAETGNQLNLIGLLIAGIIIATIGILDDIAVTQASIVYQLAGANKELDPKRLFAKAMAVGRDHIAAVINTLAMAYAGAALPLLLLLHVNAFPLGFVINSEIISEEIVRTLIASSGLVLAVPITTALTVFLVKRRSRAE